jgi:CxxC motif-containing protein (DUF1111 family)
MRLSQLTSAITLTIFLSACGGSSSTPTPAPTPTPVPTPTPTPLPTLDHSGLTPLSSDQVEKGEHLTGGDITVFVSSKNAFSTRPTLVAKDFKADGFFTSGDHLFRTPHKGVGPVLNAGSCQGCHIKDGKGLVPASINDPMTSMFLKVGDTSGNIDPIYGDQIQTFSVQALDVADGIAGLPKHNGSVNGDELYGEAFAFVEYETITGQYADGTTYELRKPTYKIKDLSYGDFNAQVAFSARVSPAIFGSGLLEGIPSDHLLALTDPNDENNDGISGKAAMVTNVMTNLKEVGRFAYKAQNPHVLQQVSGAYRGDMGVTNSLFIEESCTAAQIACISESGREIKQDQDPDILDRQLALVEFYNKVLGVPARRGYDDNTETWDAEIVAGRKIFFETGCVDCHTPRHVTGDMVGSRLGEITLTELLPTPKKVDYLSQQVFYPYTDLLLHDMGGSCKVTRELTDGTSCTGGAMCYYVQRCEGLADDLPMGDASGSEWKTPALWGTGLIQTVNAKATFLHDGRARNHAEAILWHDGEGKAAKDKFIALSSQEREQLLAFVGSL